MQKNNQEARNWAMLCHLSSLLWFPLALVGLAIPIANIVGPLIIWLIKKNDSEFIDINGKESLNFQISFTIYGIILFVISAVLLFIYLIFAGISATNDIGFLAIFGGVLGGIWLVFLLVIIGLVQLVLVIFASVKAYRGQIYRYPFTIRFFSVPR